jgi:hypothetical protein
MWLSARGSGYWPMPVAALVSGPALGWAVGVGPALVLGS